MAEGAGLENRYMHPHIAGSNPALFARHARTLEEVAMAKRAVLFVLLLAVLAATTAVAVMASQDDEPKRTVATGLMPVGEPQQIEYHYFDSEEEMVAWQATR